MLGGVRNTTWRACSQGAFSEEEPGAKPEGHVHLQSPSASLPAAAREDEDVPCARWLSGPGPGCSGHSVRPLCPGLRTATSARPGPGSSTCPLYQPAPVHLSTMLVTPGLLKAALVTDV